MIAIEQFRAKPGTAKQLRRSCQRLLSAYTLPTGVKLWVITGKKMPAKDKTDHSDKETSPQRSAKPTSPERESTSAQIAIRKARLAPHLLSRRDVLQLRRMVGNRATGRVLAGLAQRQQAPATQGQPAQQDDLEEGNDTGMPDGLKAGVESLSGMPMDDVRVHYNSSKPAGLQALAYTQGPEIHVGPGQEKHLPHEAWHVAQQKQGRVKPTAQLQGVEINDDSVLEREADVMGEQALQMPASREEGVQERQSGGVAHTELLGNPVFLTGKPRVGSGCTFELLRWAVRLMGPISSSVRAMPTRT